MKNKIQIAYCIPAIYYPSGMERVLILKANYLTEKGYKIHIIITDGKNKKPYYDIHPDVSIHQLDIDYEELYHFSLVKRIFKYCAKQRQFKKKLDECLNTIKPDITISLLRRDINFINKMTDGSIKLGEIHFSKSNYRDFKHSKLPTFIQDSIKFFWMKQLIRHLKKLNKFIVLSYEDQKEWTELDNTMVIYNPLSFYPPQQSTCENKQVIAVGRYVEQKGFDRLIDAWSIVEKKHPDWTLKIFGDGMRERLQHQINCLNIQTCILEHSVPNIIDKYIESSIFVLSSNHEGFGMVIVEAMACGVPPIAFTCPCGPKDIIQNQIDGILVENGNIPELAQQICYLIENEDIRKEMGKNSRENVIKFLPENIMNQWITLFDTLIN